MPSIPQHINYNHEATLLPFKMAADMDIDMDLDIGLVEEEYPIPEVEIIPDFELSVSRGIPL